MYFCCYFCWRGKENLNAEMRYTDVAANNRFCALECYIAQQTTPQKSGPQNHLGCKRPLGSSGPTVSLALAKSTPKSCP